MDLAKPGAFLVGGTPILECAKFSYKLESGDQDLDLLVLGSGNFSDGALKISINGEFAVLPNKQGYNFDKTCALHQTVLVSFVTGNLTYPCQGRFVSSGGEEDPNKPRVRNVEFKGALIGLPT